MSNWYDMYRASFPDYADLAPSMDTPGWLRGFFLGSDGIGGHAEFSKVDLRPRVAIVVAVSVAVGVVGTLVVVKNAPRIKSWWHTKAIPAVQAARNRISGQHDTAIDDATADGIAPDVTPIEAFCRGIDVAVEDSRSSMSSAEAQQHLLEIMLAASIIADRMRELSNARIEDDADLPKLKSAMEKLTTQQFLEAVNRMLAANPSMINVEMSGIFATLFSGGHVIDGAYVPLRSDRVKQALTLDPQRMEPASEF
jgi:hypothetical protein